MPDLQRKVLELALKQNLISEEEITDINKWLELSGDKNDDISTITILKERHILDESTLKSLESQILSEESSSLNDFDLEEEELPKELLKGFNSYRDLEFLGEGGMARVYRAFDNNLNRFVALKFLIIESPALLRRFLAEARLQARVEHDRICKVYEIGEIQGRRYISMQYIEGVSLAIAVQNSSVQEKLRIIKEVATAVDAAHHFGLIHRDLKPGNIMVKTEHDGNKIPFVMDFGLAKEITAPGITATGIITGTPSYMSPEQAEGESEKLTPQSDIYSLGATLYRLLSGRPPFTGNNSFEVLMKVIHEEPSPLRKVNSDIAVDVESIVMKCMEKEPSRRYASAAELAKDIGRYLASEPILARRSNVSYRIKKKIRKNPIVSGLSLATLLIITVSSFLLFRSSVQGRQQLRIANEFSEQVKFAQDSLRYAYAAPLHNVQPEKNALQKIADKITVEMRQQGEIALGPGTHALGSINLALHKYEDARQAFETAWNQYHYRTPETAYGLGLSLAMLYQNELQIADHISGKIDRQKRKEELQRKYRDSALDYITEGKKAASESPEYIKAMVAYLEGDFRKALTEAQITIKRYPWHYDAVRLCGDIYRSLGNEERGKGNQKDTLLNYSEAEKKYLQAIELRRSDERAYEGLCNLKSRILEVNTYQTGAPLKNIYEEGMKFCDDALVANPNSFFAMNSKSLCLIWWAQYQTTHGENPRSSLQKAFQLSQASLAIQPASEAAYHSMGYAKQLEAYYELQHGGKSQVAFELSDKFLQKAISINPNYLPAYNDGSITNMMMAEAAVADGKDPRTLLETARKKLQKILEQEPDYDYAIGNMAIAYSIEADYEIDHGIDPTVALDKAIAGNLHALKVNPDDAYSYNNAGNSMLQKAIFKFNHGQDPNSDLQDALHYFDKAISKKPNYANAFMNKGSAFRYLAVNAMSQGQDPRDAIQRGLDNFQSSKTINPDNAKVFSRLGSLFCVQAEFESAHGRSPTKSIEKAREALLQALQISNSDAEIQVRAADIELLAAREEIRKNINLTKILDTANDYLQKALLLNPHLAEIFRANAESELLSIESLGLNKAQTEQHLEKGLSFCEKAISINPTMAEVWILKGKLLYQSSKLNGDSFRESLVHEAKQAFDHAFSINSNLKLKYSDDLQKMN
jgi:eukaryotic-like serine/threonine-protein kinase